MKKLITRISFTNVSFLNSVFFSSSLLKLEESFVSLHIIVELVDLYR